MNAVGIYSVHLDFSNAMRCLLNGIYVKTSRTHINESPYVNFYFWLLVLIYVLLVHDLQISSSCL